MVRRKALPKRSKAKRAKSDSREERAEVEGEYSVEAILDWGLHYSGKLMYLLKWEHCSAEHNSWQFEQHVAHCDPLIAHFRANTANGRHAPKYSWQEWDNLCLYLRHVCDRHYADVVVLARLSKHKPQQLVKSPQLVDQIKAEINNECDSLVKRFTRNRNNDRRIEAHRRLDGAMKRLRIDSNFDNIRQFLEFVDNRNTIETQLSKLSNEWNSIIKKNKGSLVVTLVNDVDIETPQHFDYITECIYDSVLGRDIEMIDEPLVGCECEDCYAERDECCCAVIGFEMAYDRNGLLASRDSELSFECNSLCKCGPNCPNRGTQRDNNCRLQVFRTDKGERGWGVRSVDPIARGEFVCPYVGEIISICKADRRDNTYLYELGSHLDANDNTFTYVVDARKYGNVSRFINHSCEPNCRAVFVWSNNYDKQVPTIALFAIKPILAFEELTYDYGSQGIDLCDDLDIGDDGVINESPNYSPISSFGVKIRVSDQKSVNLVKSHSKIIKSNQNQKISSFPFKKIECLCGSSICRKNLYF